MIFANLKQQNEINIPLSRYEMHCLVLENYASSFDRRNLTTEYKEAELGYLKTVFTWVLINDLTLPKILKPCDTFDLLDPSNQSRLIDKVYEYLKPRGKAARCLKSIKRYCDFVIQKPMISLEGKKPRDLREIFGHFCNPVTPYDVPRTNSNDRLSTFYLTDAEYKFWLDFAYRKVHKSLETKGFHKNYIFFHMSIIAGELGLRRKEIIGLKVKDFLFSENKVNVLYGKGSKGSGNKPRKVSMSSKCKEYIQNYIVFLKLKPDSWLFINSNGKPVTKDLASKWFYEFAQEIKLTGKIANIEKGFGWHSLRRTKARRKLSKKDVDLQQYREEMGWSLLSTAASYIGGVK